MLATKAAPRKLIGSARPRIAPPTPAKHKLAALKETAKAIGITLMPWQEESVKYLTATAPDGTYLFKEVAVVVARQNGKTRMLVPLIVSRLLDGRRIMHTAQNRVLPREVFDEVADIITRDHGDKLKRKPRYANGQEEVRLTNGGSYRIVAPSRGGARGPSNDDVIVDEVREMVDYDFIAAAKPTLTASSDRQIIYLSNAGEADSVVLNDIRKRRDDDPILCYLEWSAAPERTADDPLGWSESNPGMGHLDGILGTLQDEYRTAVLSDTMAIFETEHLCRWVETTVPRVVQEPAWLACKGTTGKPTRPAMAVSIDPSGRRGSVALAWPVGRKIMLHIDTDVQGSPIDVDQLGEDVQARAVRLGSAAVGYDPRTDRDLARWLKKGKAVQGNDWMAASDKFDRLVRAGSIVWDNADAVTDDLRWLGRKTKDTGAWEAVRINDEMSVTAGLAAIRAVWLASEPRTGIPRVL